MSNGDGLHLTYSYFVKKRIFISALLHMCNAEIVLTRALATEISFTLPLLLRSIVFEMGYHFHIKVYARKLRIFIVET